jgi:hypothetical protein
MTNDEIEQVIQEMYAWASKRDATNKAREGDPSFRKLDNNLIRKAIRTIQDLTRERPLQDDAPQPPRHRL